MSFSRERHALGMFKLLAATDSLEHRPRSRGQEIPCLMNKKCPYNVDKSKAEMEINPQIKNGRVRTTSAGVVITLRFMNWRVMAQEVSCLLLTVEVGVHSQISSCVIRGETSSNGAGLLRVLRFLP